MGHYVKENVPYRGNLFSTPVRLALLGNGVRLMRASFIFAVFLALACDPASAREPPKRTTPDVMIYGAGGFSCTRAWQQENVSFSTNWVLGFWSGVNNTRGLLVGSKTDADGILGEVKRVCAARPAIRLYEAVDQAFANLHSQGL